MRELSDQDFEERDQPGNYILSDKQLRYAAYGDTSNYAGEQITEHLEEPLDLVKGGMGIRFRYLMEDIVALDGLIPSHNESIKNVFQATNLPRDYVNGYTYLSEPFSDQQYFGAQLGYALQILIKQKKRNEITEDERIWKKMGISKKEYIDLSDSELSRLLIRLETEDKITEEEKRKLYQERDYFYIDTQEHYRRLLAGLIFPQLEVKISEGTDVETQIENLLSNLHNELLEMHNAIEGATSNEQREEIRENRLEQAQKQCQQAMAKHCSVTDEELVETLAGITFPNTGIGQKLIENNSRILSLMAVTKQLLTKDTKRIEESNPEGQPGEDVLDAVTNSIILMRDYNSNAKLSEANKQAKRTGIKYICQSISKNTFIINNELKIDTNEFQSHLTISKQTVTKVLEYLRKKYSLPTEPHFPIVDDENGAWKITPYGALILVFRLDKNRIKRTIHEFGALENTVLQDGNFAIGPEKFLIEEFLKFIFWEELKEDLGRSAVYELKSNFPKLMNKVIKKEYFRPNPFERYI